MTSDELISMYRLRVMSEPVPKEVERGIMDAERRLRAQALSDIARTTGAWLMRVYRGREAQPAHTDRATTPAPTA